MVLTTSSTHSNCPQKNNRLNYKMYASLSHLSVTPPSIFTAMSFTATHDSEPNHFDTMIFASILQMVRLKRSTMAPLFCLSPSICLSSTVCCIQLHFIASANPTFSYQDFAAKTVMKHSLFEPVLLWKPCCMTAHTIIWGQKIYIVKKQFFLMSRLDGHDDCGFPLVTICLEEKEANNFEQHNIFIV